jgi:hypothetical protein
MGVARHTELDAIAAGFRVGMELEVQSTGLTTAFGQSDSKSHFGL